MRRLFKSSLIHLGILAIGVALSQDAVSRDRYRSIWLDQYSDRSRSGEASCQLCHERISGGDGWNQYGWDLRQVFESNRLAVGSGFASEAEALIASLRVLEQFKTDLSDPQSSTYLAEILSDAQPGWRDTSDNIIVYKSGATNSNAAPADLSCLTRIDANSPLEVCPLQDPILESIKQQEMELSLLPIVAGFTAVTGITSTISSSDKLYIVERAGKVWEIDTARHSKRLFLDFSRHLVSLSSGADEQRGLLGFAFHPSYADNGIVTTHLSKPYRTGAAHFSSIGGEDNVDHLSVISQWNVLDNATGDAALPTNEVEIMVMERTDTKPGGELSFGPDGYLYIAIGAQDDVGINTSANSQLQIFGSILRIDIDSANPSNGRYAIPTSNPYIGEQESDELFAVGFRAAQGLSFSTIDDTGEIELYLIDKGEEHIQEVNRIPSSSDVISYGWPQKEGAFYRYQPATGLNFISVVAPPNTNLPLFVDPIAEYDKDEGTSIIGGLIYHGKNLPALSGSYVFGDFATDNEQNNSSRLFFLNSDNEIRDIGSTVMPGLTLQSIGAGPQQDLYLVAGNSNTASDGVLFKLQSLSDDFCHTITAKKGNSFTICL